MVSLSFARLEWKESSNVSLAFLSKYILENIEFDFCKVKKKVVIVFQKE